ncbi:hypothetical protein F5B19DRAFT_489425 [Rostrohypoxylon terebratum]|nr:hypothetical protein F5B19DRAFT_489425 [Rostrohypoxylon terebratum]
MANRRERQEIVSFSLKPDLVSLSWRPHPCSDSPCTLVRDLTLYAPTTNLSLEGAIEHDTPKFFATLYVPTVLTIAAAPTIPPVPTTSLRRFQKRQLQAHTNQSTDLECCQLMATLSPSGATIFSTRTGGGGTSPPMKVLRKKMLCEMEKSEVGSRQRTPYVSRIRGGIMRGLRHLALNAFNVKNMRLPALHKALGGHDGSIYQGFGECNLLELEKLGDDAQNQRAPHLASDDSSWDRLRHSRD